MKDVSDEYQTNVEFVYVILAFQHDRLRTLQVASRQAFQESHDRTSL